MADRHPLRPDYVTDCQWSYVLSMIDRATSEWEAQGARFRPGSEATASANTSTAAPMSAAHETNGDSAGGARLTRTGTERGCRVPPLALCERSERPAPSPNDRHRTQ